MTKNLAKIPTELSYMVELIDESEVSSQMGEAFASFLLNPTVAWAKFVLTDDRKNGNNQRVPKTEFQNLIKSGIHMPVKMAIGEINSGHDNSKPLGVITHLKETSMPDGSSAIIALAALWEEERPADVALIRNRFAENKPVNISWEILFSDFSINHAMQSMDLLETVLKAATIVGDPAYEGRTQILTVAAKKWSKAYLEELPDSSFLYVDRLGKRFFPIKNADGKIEIVKLKEAMASLGDAGFPGEVLKEKKALLSELISRYESSASDEEVLHQFEDLTKLSEEMNKMNVDEIKAELEKVQAQLSEALASLEENKKLLEEKEAALASKGEEIANLTEEKTKYETELASLREFKAEIDKEAEAAKKLEEVKKKFVEAGLEKEDNYFVENSEKLLAMDGDQLDFIIQEFKAFSNSNSTSNSSKKHNKIPVLTGDDESSPTISDMADYLRNKGKK